MVVWDITLAVVGLLLLFAYVRVFFARSCVLSDGCVLCFVFCSLNVHVYMCLVRIA